MCRNQTQEASTPIKLNVHGNLCCSTYTKCTNMATKTAIGFVWEGGSWEGWGTYRLGYNLGLISAPQSGTCGMLVAYWWGEPTEACKVADVGAVPAHSSIRASSISGRSHTPSIIILTHSAARSCWCQAYLITWMLLWCLPWFDVHHNPCIPPNVSNLRAWLMLLSLINIKSVVKGK